MFVRSLVSMLLNLLRCMVDIKYLPLSPSSTPLKFEPHAQRVAHLLLSDCRRTWIEDPCTPNRFHTHAYQNLAYDQAVITARPRLLMALVPTLRSLTLVLLMFHELHAHLADLPSHKSRERSMSIPPPPVHHSKDVTVPIYVS